MRLGIGIDTGGTYTDAVIYEFETRRVLAKGKSRTIKEDLAQGISAALDCLPADLARQAAIVSLSTTLATNACVEGKGGRAKVVLIGTNENVLRRIGAAEKYGFSYDDALCIDMVGAFDGSTISMPDWDAFIDENIETLSQAQAFGIAEMYAERNGALVEHAGERALSERFGVPVVIASNLVRGLNMMERGATAVLNARLLPVIDEFLDAARRALEQRGIDAPVMIVRSDASLMNEQFARTTPVETMVSGPAASVQGCHELANEPNAVIVDMGGTTSDISLVEQGKPAMTTGIRIGNWRTQVHGVLIDTIGLGGDSAVVYENGSIELAETRVEPLCMAVARWPHLLGRLQELVELDMKILRPLYEVLYLVKEPSANMVYTEKELRLVELLRKGPVLLFDQDEFEYFELERGAVPARLESEGIVMRCGLTPTDIMHIRGDFDQFSTEASLLAARFICQTMRMFGDGDEGVQALCDTIYELVQKKLFMNIARVMLAYRYPDTFADGLPKGIERALEKEWNAYKAGKNAEGNDEGLKLEFKLNAPLVGIGAPIHVFLSDVADALGTTCVVPEHAEVANAIGAVVASIAAQVVVRVIADWTAAGIDGYVVHADETRVEYPTREEAIEAAKEAASKAACALARSRGAVGPLEVEISVDNRESIAEGARIYHGSSVTAVARPL